MSDPAQGPILPGPRTRALRGATAHAELHQGLDAYVLELVTRREDPGAVLFFSSLLRRNLQEHMRCEEASVLPWWMVHEEAPPVNATVACFEEDHRLLRGQVQALQEEAVRAAGRRGGPWRLRELIAGLDDLLEHHDQREAETLYPRLESAADAPARRVREDLAATGLVTVDQGRLLCEGWTSLVRDRVLGTYRAWALEEALPGTESWDFLRPSARPRARLLAARDRDLVERYRARSFPDERSRLSQERLVEQTLRRTVLVLSDAFLDPCFDEGD